MSNLTNRPIYQKGQGTAAKKGAKTPIRKSAKGENCTLRLAGCRNDTETTVLCHIRKHGWGGMGIKPNDLLAFYGCSHCHSREVEASAEDLHRAHGETLVALLANGTITVNG